MTRGLETVITSRAAAVVAASAGRPGPAAHTARAWIDSMTARPTPLGTPPAPHAGRATQRQVID